MLVINYKKLVKMEIEDRLAYIIAVVSEFAARFSLNTQQAYRYLDRRTAGMKAAIEREQNQTGLDFAECGQARPKVMLYHGSNVAIESIDFSKSKPGKDFGVGFYLSPDEKQAQELADFWQPCRC